MPCLYHLGCDDVLSVLFSIHIILCMDILRSCSQTKLQSHTDHMFALYVCKKYNCIVSEHAKDRIF